MAHVFTVKSNANRKVRAIVEQYPGSCKAEDFTVERVEGGFVIRMTVRDEAGQAFARYHDFEYAVPGIEPAAKAPTAEAPEDDVLDLPEGFKLGRAASEVPDIVGYLSQGLTEPAGRKARAAAAPVPKAPHAGPGKFAAIREAAERGELPPVPDFSADLHRRNRGRLAQLVAMAEAGDVAGLEAFPIAPNCTSPKAMDRYRNLCVIALKTRAAKPEA
jgi:hypothetical protein